MQKYTQKKNLKQTSKQTKEKQINNRKQEKNISLYGNNECCLKSRFYIGHGTTMCGGINSHYVIPTIPVVNEICNK